MKSMTGMVLMIVGALCFIVGFILYSSSNNHSNQRQPAQQVSNTATEQDQVIHQASVTSIDQRNPVAQISESNSELEKVINMAIADGVLTNNERNIIKQLTYSKGLDFNDVIKDVENRISQSDGIAETEIVDVNKKHGEDFEKFIAQKFEKKFFKIKEWAGDKFVNGTYAQTTQQPDLLLELDIKRETAELSVECKWRSNFYKNGVEFANPEQFKRYQNFEESRNVPVFIAIGIGGSGAKPEQLFILPLRRIRSNFVPINVLTRYEKKVGTEFFYDIKSKVLR